MRYVKTTIKEIVYLFLVEPLFWYKLWRFHKPNRKRMVLIGTPVHGNLGDHLIGMAEQQFMNEYFSEYEIIECTMPFSKIFLDYINEHTDENTVVMISGGGWLGTEWRHNEDFVRRVLIEFEGKPIIILPQTVFYRDDELYVELGQKIYSCSKDLRICVRDKNSYLFLKNKGFIKEENLYYLPDMALLYEQPIRNTREKRGMVGVCFRDDIEAILETDLSDGLIDFLQGEGIKIKKIYTNKRGVTIKPTLRQQELNKLLSEIASVDLLITDRLHAMIMACITNTPCIAFDNSTHKVSGVYEWIKEFDYIKFFNKGDNVYGSIKNMLSSDFKCQYDRDIFRQNIEDLVAIFRKGGGEDYGNYS